MTDSELQEIQNLWDTVVSMQKGRSGGRAAQTLIGSNVVPRLIGALRAERAKVGACEKCEGMGVLIVYPGTSWEVFAECPCGTRIPIGVSNLIATLQNERERRQAKEAPHAGEGE